MVHFKLRAEAEVAMLAAGDKEWNQEVATGTRMDAAGFVQTRWRLTGYMSHLETGVRPPTLAVVRKFAAAFGISENEFNAFPDPATLADPFDHNEPNPHAQCVPDYAYEEIERENARLSHQLLRALERQEQAEERNALLEEMYAAVRVMHLNGWELKRRTIVWSDYYTSSTYVVISPDFEDGKTVEEFDMLLDAWLHLKKVAMPAKEASDAD